MGAPQSTVRKNHRFKITTLKEVCISQVGEENRFESLPFAFQPDLTVRPWLCFLPGVFRSRIWVGPGTVPVPFGESLVVKRAGAKVHGQALICFPTTVTL